MFKVFKKKKTGLTPASKSKSLFSLNKSGEKHEKSKGSGVVLDKVNPVQTISMQYQIGYEQITPDVQHSPARPSYSSRPLKFRSFLADDAGCVTQNGTSRNGIYRSRSADNLDMSGVEEIEVDSPDRTFIDVGTEERRRHTFQVPLPDLPPSPEPVTSLFLEEIQEESRLRSSHSTQFLSSFKAPSPPQNTDGTEIIPVPEGFSSPDSTEESKHSEKDQCLSETPDLDSVSLASNRVPIILPPQAFTDPADQLQSTSLPPGEKIHDHSDLSDYSHNSSRSSFSNTSQDGTNINGESKYVTTSAGKPVAFVNPRKPPRPSGGSTINTRSRSNANRQITPNHPALPPKPPVIMRTGPSPAKGRMVLLSQQSGDGSNRNIPYTPNDDQDLRLGKTNCRFEDINQNTYCSKMSIQLADKIVGDGQSSESKLKTTSCPVIETNVNSNDLPRVTGTLTRQNSTVSLARVKPTPPPRRHRSGSAARPPLVKEPSVGSDTELYSLATSRSCSKNFAPVAQPPATDPETQDRNISQSVPSVITEKEKHNYGKDENDNNPKDETVSVYLPVSSPTNPASSESKEHERAKLKDIKNKLNDSSHIKQSSIDSEASSHEEVPPVIIVDTPDAQVMISSKTDHLETSSRLSGKEIPPDFEVCSVSTINESQQFIISDSFLFDTTISELDQNQESDQQIDYKVTVDLDDDGDLINVEAFQNADTTLCLNESDNLMISDSFLNDTATPLLNYPLPVIKPVGDVAVIVEDDYVPSNLPPTIPNHPVILKESPPQQPWQVSMATSWNHISPKKIFGIPDTAIRDGVLDESSDSESTVTDEENEDEADAHNMTEAVYRWQLKPVSLWDTDDVCQWLDSKGHESVAVQARDQEITGEHLMQLPLDDLGELASSGKIRQKLIHDVHTLRTPEAKQTYTDITKVSLKRKTLEQNSQVISNRLNDLTWLNEQQKENISKYLNQLEQEQANANTLLVEQVNGNHQAHFTMIPIMKWTNDDVLEWLESIGMGKFSPMFKAHSITGHDLITIDMELLDSVGISSVQDRELVLSKLYELQNQKPLTPHLPNKVQEIFKAPSLDSNSSSDKNDNRSTSRKLFPNDGTRMNEGGSSNQKLTVWHDFTGKPIASSVQVFPSQTCRDVLHCVLKDHSVPHDSGLYYITQITVNNTTYKVTTKDLKENDCPFAICRDSSSNAGIKSRLEIKKRTGFNVKIMYTVDNEVSTNKIVEVSSVCTCGELLRLGLLAFSISNMDNPYRLLAITRDRDSVREVENSKLVSFYQCEAFQLCEAHETIEIITPSSTDQLEGAFHTKQKSVSRKSQPTFSIPPTVLPESNPMVEGANNHLTYIELDPDLTISTDDAENLSVNSDDFDHLSAVTDVMSLCDDDLDSFPTPNVYPNVNSFRKNGMILGESHGDMSELREGLLEKDKIIHRLQIENEEAQKERKLARDLQTVVTILERDMTGRQRDLKAKFSQLEKDLQDVRTKVHSMTGNEEEVDVLEQGLLVTGQQIQLVEQKITIIQAKITATKKPPRIDAAALESLKQYLADTDTYLLDLKQQQADVYKQLKMARKQLAKQKTQMDPDRFSMHKLLTELGHNPSVLHQIHSVTLDLHNNKCDFILGSDLHNRPLVKHAEQSNCPLIKGDRILEVNGVVVTHLSDVELSRQLKQTSNKPVSMVVLRKGINYELKVQERVEEAESLREDLAMTMVELETAQEEVMDVKNQLEELTFEHEELKQQQAETESELQGQKLVLLQQKTDHDAQLQQLRQQLAEKELEIQKLENQSPKNISIKSPKTMLYAISRTPSTLSKRSDSGVKTQTDEDLANRSDIKWIQSTVSGEVDEGDIVLAYEDYEPPPMWESLQLAPKEEILQALKDQILENHQQKSYLDHLLTAVIDHAPSLLQAVDEYIGVQDQNDLTLKARTEEFC